MIARMTTAWGVRVTSLLAYGFCFLATLYVFAAGVAFVTDRTFLASLDPAFALIAHLCLPLWAVFWLRGQRASGRVLLDCGPQSLKGLLLLGAVVWSTQGLWSVITRGGASFAEDVQKLLIAVFFLATALGRLQVRENGIWEYGSLLRWHKIISYRWADDGTLITYRRGYLMTLRGDLPVPPEQREAVNAFLLARAPQAREP